MRPPDVPLTKVNEIKQNVQTARRLLLDRLWSGDIALSQVLEAGWTIRQAIRQSTDEAGKPPVLQPKDQAIRNARITTVLLYATTGRNKIKPKSTRIQVSTVRSMLNLVSSRTQIEAVRLAALERREIDRLLTVYNVVTSEPPADLPEFWPVVQSADTHDLVWKMRWRDQMPAKEMQWLTAYQRH